MANPANASGRSVAVDLVQDYAVFDALPPRLRARLRECVVPFSASELVEMTKELSDELLGGFEELPARDRNEILENVALEILIESEREQLACNPYAPKDVKPLRPHTRSRSLAARGATGGMRSQRSYMRGCAISSASY